MTNSMRTHLRSFTTTEVLTSDFRSRIVLPLFDAEMQRDDWATAYESVGIPVEGKQGVRNLIWWDTYRYMGFKPGATFSIQRIKAVLFAYAEARKLISQSDIVASYPDNTKPFVFPLAYSGVDSDTIEEWSASDIVVALKLYIQGFSESIITEILTNDIDVEMADALTA